MAFLKDHSFREFSWNIIKTVLYLIGRIRIASRGHAIVRTEKRRFINALITRLMFYYPTEATPQFP